MNFAALSMIYFSIMLFSAFLVYFELCSGEDKIKKYPVLLISVLAIMLSICVFAVYSSFVYKGI